MDSKLSYGPHRNRNQRNQPPDPIREGGFARGASRKLTQPEGSEFPSELRLLLTY